MTDPNELEKAKARLLAAAKRNLYMLVLILAITTLLTLAVNWWFLPIGLLFLALFAYFATSVHVSSGIVIKNLWNKGNMPSIISHMGSATTLDPSKLQGRYQEAMQRALDRRQRIHEAIAETGDPGTRHALTNATQRLEELVTTIYDLAFKAQSVQTGLQSTDTLSALTNDIKRLENSIKTTNDEFQKSQYYATLDGKLQQMQNFTDTRVALDRWNAQLDNALSTMDTILSQVLRIRSSEMLSYENATDEVSNSLHREVDNLKATSDALDSVYGASK